MTALLRAEGLSVAFEGVHAVEDVDVELGQGEILGLIGPNGAGKTTVVNALTGYVRPNAGEIHVGPERTTGWGPGRLARAGVARTFQNVRLFGPLTVPENVEVGGARRSAAAPRRDRDDAATCWRASTSPTGPRRPAGRAALRRRARLGIARALAQRPRLLLLDEPAAGLNEAESDELLEVLATIREQLGCGLLVIEHDMRLIMRLCDRVQVLDHGRTIAVGSASRGARATAAVLERVPRRDVGDEDARQSTDLTVRYGRDRRPCARSRA